MFHSLVLHVFYYFLSQLFTQVFIKKKTVCTKWHHNHPKKPWLSTYNKTFLNHSKDCQGSEHDVLEVDKLFQDLWFKVTTKENLTKSQLLGELDVMACEDHSWYDYLLLWLMSHGDKDFVYGTDSEKIFLEIVRKLFSNSSCSSLDGKPKVVFTQACGGHWEEFVD